MKTAAQTASFIKVSINYVKITGIMGQITIEIPQNINRKYRIVSESSATEILSRLEKIVKDKNKIDDEDILSLWADRQESVEETTRN